MLFIGCKSHYEKKASSKSDFDIERENIANKKIKSVTLREHKKFITGEIDPNGAFMSFLKYDVHGNILEKKEYEKDEEDTNHFYRTYVYDSFGNVIEKYDYDSDYNLDMKWTYKYDNTGKNIIEEITFGELGTIINKETNKFNNKGLLVQSTIFSTLLGETSNYKNVYEYDLNDNLIKKIVYPSDGGNSYTSTSYEYNKFGNLVEQNAYDSSGHNYETISYDYDENGNIIEKESNFVEYKIKNTFDSKGNKIEIVEWSKEFEELPTQRDKWIIKYDNNNNKIEEAYYNSKDELRKSVV